MNQSSVTTGSITFTAASLEPVVSWAVNGFHAPIPEAVPLLLSAFAIAIGHAAYNVMKTKGWLPSDNAAADNSPAAEA